MIIKVNGQTIEAEVADNFFKRMMGLSFTRRKNMLFIMDYEARWSLWMFAVKYPLKMVFMDSRKKVIDIKNGVPITDDPNTWKIYKPKEDCKYILETPFDLKIKIGDRLKWSKRF
jgi:uncharacterized membrane protein (UPF0127 family)